VTSDRPLVALDLDDVIFPFMRTMVPWLNNELGTAVKVDDFFTYNFEQVVGGTRDRAVNLMEQFFAEMKSPPAPVEGALEAIGLLSAEFSLAVITSRTDSMRVVTLEWVETHFPGTFMEVFLTNNYVTDDRPTKRAKVDICCEMNALALVDDNYDYVCDVAEAGMAGILFGEFAWNCDRPLPAGVTRAKDWKMVTDKLLTLVSKSSASVESQTVR
jgi:5'(3')-deoxyribonucleotidase